jgi:Ca2+/Na+ antiporter
MDEGQCVVCGLTPAAAEILFRRRLLRRTAIFLLGALAFMPASHWYPPLELDGILIFVGVMFFLTLALAVWLERRAHRHEEVEALKRVYFSLVLLPWLLGALLVINGAFDAEPPASRVTSVVGKFSMPGMLHSSRLVVVSWRPGRRFERVPVGRDDFDRFRRGDAIEVKVQAGLAGIPWVYAVRRR